MLIMHINNAHIIKKRDEKNFDKFLQRKQCVILNTSINLVFICLKTIFDNFIIKNFTNQTLKERFENK